MEFQPPSLTPEGCRARQRRLRDVIGREALDCAIVEDPRDILYFTGAHLQGWFPALLFVPKGGESLLVRNTGGPRPLVGEVTDYAGQDMCSTLRRMREAMAAVFRQAVPALPGPRVGVSAEHGSFAVAAALRDMDAASVDIDAPIFHMQQLKDPDEVALLREAIRANEAGYQAVRRELRPGLLEIEVFEIAHAAICRAAGQVVDFAGDFRSGEAGGRARPRPIPDNELYIVDSYPTVNGYWSDMARTFAVGDPTPEQQQAHAQVAAALDVVQATVKPGLPTAELFQRLKQMLSDLPGEVQALPHHGGHGIGLRPHEWPTLWPHSEDTFQQGQVFTCEPGVYADRLRAGVRLEETYLVTATSVERLTQFPLALQ